MSPSGAYNGSTIVQFIFAAAPFADGSFLILDALDWSGVAAVAMSSSKSLGPRRWQDIFEPSLPTDPSQTALRYVLAVLAAIAALLIRKALVPLLGNGNPYHIAWLAVIFSAWYCGFWQSLVAVAIETLGVWYWFLPPFDSLRIPNRSDIYGMLGFVFFGFLLSILGESFRRTISRKADAEERAHRAIVRALVLNPSEKRILIFFRLRLPIKNENTISRC